MNCHKLFLVVSFLAVFGFVFLSAPSAKAATVDELQALINNLMAQIASLQKQMADLQGGTPVAWCHDFNTNLKYGDSGSEVTALQTALTKDGATSWEYKGYDGVFDEMTASAVVGFQEKYKSEILTPSGLKNGTGFVGPATRKKLNSIYGCGVTQPPTTPSITVISPNGGEQWKMGSTYDITWKSQGIDKVFITVVDYGTQDTCRLTYDVENYVSAEKGKYSWTIGSGKCSVSPGDKFKIEIQEPEGTRSPRIKDQSDSYFGIVAADTSVVCTDSDSGKDYFTKGTTKWGPIGGKYYEATDKCDSAGKTLSEFYYQKNHNQRDK